MALNGKKRKIRLSDFRVVILASGLAEKVIANMEKKFRKALPKWFETIGASFLPSETKKAYKRLNLERAAKLYKQEVQ